MSRLAQMASNSATMPCPSRRRSLVECSHGRSLPCLRQVSRLISASVAARVALAVRMCSPCIQTCSATSMPSSKQPRAHCLRDEEFCKPCARGHQGAADRHAAQGPRQGLGKSNCTCVQRRATSQLGATTRTSGASWSRCTTKCTKKGAQGKSHSHTSIAYCHGFLLFYLYFICMLIFIFILFLLCFCLCVSLFIYSF